MSRLDEKNVLVCIMNNQHDFEIARDRHWYRIPVKSAPKIVRNLEARYLAFYFTKVFGEKSFSVRWYAEIERFTIQKRKELFPDDVADPKRNEDYFKIQIGTLKPLKKPIISRRWRRIVFIETTSSRLMHAEEINDLYHESPLEDELWRAFKSERIDAERQYFVNDETQRFCLDFALFCKQRNIDVECDGDAYHLQPRKMRRDKKRNNILGKLGWSILRYSSDDIYKHLPKTINQVKETINTLGGLQIVGKKKGYRLFTASNQSRQQESLFRKGKNLG